MLISSRLFCVLVGMGHDRLEQRRLRERAAADVSATLGEDDLAAMPITPIGHGERAAYDGFDAVKLRCVIALELAGVQFAAGCRLISGVYPAVMFPSSDDTVAAAWSDVAGTTHRIVATEREIAWAVPKSPRVFYSINITSVLHEVGRRAKAQLGLRVVGMGFERIEQ